MVSSASDETLRLLWPQWQGAGSEALTALAEGFSLGDAREGYSLGARVLDAIVPARDAVAARVEVPASSDALSETGGIELRDDVLAQLRAAV